MKTLKLITFVLALTVFCSAVQAQGFYGPQTFIPQYSYGNYIGHCHFPGCRTLCPYSHTNLLYSYPSVPFWHLAQIQAQIIYSCQIQYLNCSLYSYHPYSPYSGNLCTIQYFNCVSWF